VVILPKGAGPGGVSTGRKAQEYDLVDGSLSTYCGGMGVDSSGSLRPISTSGASTQGVSSLRLGGGSVGGESETSNLSYDSIRIDLKQTPSLRTFDSPIEEIEERSD